jgi:copper chaperone
VAKVTPVLNAAESIQKWEVDINNPDKILTVETNSLTAEDVIKEVKKTGFKIEQLN